MWRRHPLSRLLACRGLLQQRECGWAVEQLLLPPQLAFARVGGGRGSVAANGGSCSSGGALHRLLGSLHSLASAQQRSAVAAEAEVASAAADTRESAARSVAAGLPRGKPAGRRQRPGASKAADALVEAAILSAVASSDRELWDRLLQQQPPNTWQLNAALRAVPDAHLPRLLNWLWGQQAETGSAAAAGETSTAAEPRPAAGVGPNADTARILAERLPAHKSLRWELDGWMRRLQAAGLQPHYYWQLAWAGAHASAGNPAGVRHVMAEVEKRGGKPASPQYWSLLIRAYSTCGRWKEAGPLLEEMRQRGVEPSEQVYRSLIVCCGQHRRADQAQRIFEELRASGAQPSAATWAALVNAYAEAGQAHKAVDTLRSMRQLGMAPSIQAFGALAKAFSRTGDWRRAVDVLDLMQAQGLAPNAQVFGAAIEAAAVAGKPSVAAAVLRRMQAAGVHPNVIAYTSLLSSYAATGDLEAASGVLCAMEAAGVRPNAKTYTELMSQLASQGQYEECERLFNRMVAAGCPADHVSYAILIDSMLHRWAGDREGQQELLALVEQRWQEAASSSGPLQPHTFLHQPQGRLCLDLHGLSAWTAQLAVLATLGRLMATHQEQQQRQQRQQAAARGRGGGHASDLTRLDIITGRGNRSSTRHRPVLREVVLEMLQHVIPVSFGKANDGLLVLEARHLRRLFDTMLAVGHSFSLRDMQHCLVNPGSL